MSTTPSNLERVAGIEPASSAWKAEVLPLNYTRYSLSLTVGPVAGGTDPLQPAVLSTLTALAGRASSGGGGWIIRGFASHPPGRRLWRRSERLRRSVEPCGSNPPRLPLYPAVLSTLTALAGRASSGGGGWIRTTEAFASDLQSDPFGHSGTPPKGGILSGCPFALSTVYPSKIIALRPARENGPDGAGNGHRAASPTGGE